MKLRINEALQYAKDNGRRVWKKDLAAKLWPGSSEISRKTNFKNLLDGDTARVAPEWIRIICEETGVSANFLLGIENN